MLLELLQDYIPNRLLFREEQIEKLENVYNQFKEFGISNNHCLLGPTGTGKSTVINFVLKNKDKEYYTLISAKGIKKTYAIFQKILKSKSNNYLNLMDDIIKEFKEKRRILIIDELNLLNDMDVFWDCLNNIYRQTSIPIIIVTYNPNIIETMPEDARLTLFFAKIEFLNYDSEQLYKIAQDRLSLINTKLKSAVTEEGLRYVCGYSKKTNSGRTMFNLIRRCLLSNDFSEKKIQEFIKEDDYSEMHNFVLGMTETERKFLEVLTDLIIKNPRNIIKTPDLYKSLPNFSPQRIAQLITTFEKEYCFLHTHFSTYKKRGGRYRIIEVEPLILSKLIGVI